MGFKPKYLTYEEASNLAKESLSQDLSGDISVTIQGDKDVWYMLINGLTADNGPELCKITGKSILDVEIKEVYSGKTDQFYTTDENFLQRVLYPEGGVVKIFATDNGLFTITKNGENSLSFEASYGYVQNASNKSWFALALSEALEPLETALLAPEESDFSNIIKAIAKTHIALYAIEQLYNISDSDIISELRKYR